MQDKDANNPDLERRRFIRNAGTGALAVVLLRRGTKKGNAKHLAASTTW